MTHPADHYERSVRWVSFQRKSGSIFIDNQHLGPAKDFFFLARTDREISLVCRKEDVPEKTLEREDGWRGFRIRGVLDFSLIGILARISSLLAEAGISIFALSTYQTDYILVREGDFERALDLLSSQGYTILR